MKLLIASDIHGSLPCCEKLCAAYERESAQRMVLLGDLLYHGPRNDLPAGYNPKGVIRLLNGIRRELLCVRGNCEAEVDQMVLEFPVLSESLILFLENRMIYATHGHHLDGLPLRRGDVLLHGHTHIPVMKENDEGVLVLNPGSVSLPKENHPPTYFVYEDGVFTLRELEGSVLCSVSL